MKTLKIIRIVLSILIVFAISMQVVLSNTCGKDYGVIEGTGFVYSEPKNLRITRYAIDDEENIYIPSTNEIAIYGSFGQYLKSLILNGDVSKVAGAIGVYINECNEICVFGARSDVVETYDQKTGFKKHSEVVGSATISLLFSEYTNQYGERERKGNQYLAKGDKIIKNIDNREAIVFSQPLWQRIYSLMQCLMILSFVGLFVSFLIPSMAKIIKKHFRKE